MGCAAMAMLLLALLLSSGASSLPEPKRVTNERPVIGVLAQETHFGNLLSHGPSYLAASYVKTLESAGARVIPIRIDLPDSEYVKIFNSINGVLLPGGGVDLKISKYARVSKIFYDLAIATNDKGHYFPIWGTCLGFEELTVLTSGELLLTLTNTEDISLPLNFTEHAFNSRLFRNIPPHLFKALSSFPITANFHHWSLSMQNFTGNEKLRKFYKVLSTNADGSLEYVSTMEAYHYPFYGVQWHPEKNPFEWKNTSDISHSSEAVQVAFYMASFFVNEARKSQHQYTDEAERMYPLIYHFCPIYTGNVSGFEQMYFF
ncbi:gamma-glutamyl hydrolase [Gastrophryne carolinensis]